MSRAGFFEKRPEIVFAAAVLAASLVFICFFFSNQGYWWDEAVYLGLAKNLYEGKGYYINANQESFRPPLFPYAIFFLWKVFGQSEFAVRIMPPLFGVLSIIATHAFAKKLYGKEVAGWAALMLATTHMFLFFGLKLLTETVFMFLFALSLCLFYLGMEKNRKLLPLAGIAMALTFLTRYMGYVLPVVYAAYPLIKILATKKSKERAVFTRIFFDKFYWAGALLFLAVLAPWLWMSYVNFGSLLGALLAESSTVTTGWYVDGWTYYFAHWIEIFGLVGLFAVPAAVYTIFKIRDCKNGFTLLSVAAIIVFFALLPRKEMRYMISFLPIFAVFFAAGAAELGKWLRKETLVGVLIVIFCAINLVAGIQMIEYDMQGGYALKQAGLYLKNIAPADAKIMTQNMPVLFYTTGRQIVYFPENEAELANVITKNNVRFIVIEKREPTYPSYVWIEKDSDKLPSRVFDRFKLEKTFQEKNETFVWVYRV